MRIFYGCKRLCAVTHRIDSSVQRCESTFAPARHGLSFVVACRCVKSTRNSNIDRLASVERRCAYALLQFHRVIFTQSQTSRIYFLYIFIESYFILVNRLHCQTHGCASTYTCVYLTKLLNHFPGAFWTCIRRKYQTQLCRREEARAHTHTVGTCWTCWNWKRTSAADSHFPNGIRRESLDVLPTQK